MIAMQHIQRAHDFMAAIQTTCADRRLPMPAIREVIITERRQRVFAFAVFPQAVGHKQEAYADDRFLHQLSSTLHGMPVAVSNHTGFRLAALLDGPRAPLPTPIAPFSIRNRIDFSSTLAAETHEPPDKPFQYPQSDRLLFNSAGAYAILLLALFQYPQSDRLLFNRTR